MAKRLPRLGKFGVWWRRNDRRYGLWWRLGNGAAAVLVLGSAVLPVANQLWQNNKYQLSAETLQLVGNSDGALAQQLTYDPQTAMYQFNKAAITADGMPAEVQKAAAGAAGSNLKTYALDVPTDMAKGVRYHDTNSQLSFGLIPQFGGMDGKPQQGRIVFPLSGEHAGSQAVYTLKNNGLKEDIVVPKVTQDSMRFSYELDLPDSLEAKMIPDGEGAIGIYSADPSLFGNISYGSDADKLRVETARREADKSNLVFGLPAPVVKDLQGRDVGTARFELRGSSLTVVADDLAGTKGAITIDPSVVVTSTSDLQTGGNNENNIDFTTSGQATRGGVTGGTVSGGWSNTTAISSSSEGYATAVYNGYIYYMGGGSVSVQYAAVNGSNGTVPSWTAATSLSTSVSFPRAFAYNGYLYRVGGQQGAPYVSSTEYAPINSDGSLGSWTATTNMVSARSASAGAVYNGYMYVMGGYNGSSVQNDVQYAPINANGTLGTWATTTSFTTARSALSGFANNGYLYVMAGYNAASTYYNDVQYAPINSDGTVGTWTATTSFTTGRAGAMVNVYNGYAYLAGGTINVSTGRTDVQYAPINANGTLGTWLTTASLGTAVYSAGSVAYNGYLYVLGGKVSSGTWTANAQFAKIDPAGKPVAFTTSGSNFTTARALACSVAYNGYLYVLGGSTSDSLNNNLSTTYYSPLSTTGTTGTWTATTAMPESHGTFGCTAHNGYLYIIGGYTGTTTGTLTTLVRYVPINSNGTLGAWVTTAPGIPNNAIRPGVFTYTGSGGTYLYSVGGTGTSTYTSIYYATLNKTTGAVGAWTTASNSMTQDYFFRGYAIVGGYMYAFGGRPGASTTVTALVEYAPINANGSLGTWAATTSMNTATAFTNGTTVNGCIYAVGGEDSASTKQALVQYACPNANGSITAWQNGSNLSAATTDMAVTSYNGYLYGVGGYNTAVTTTTQYAYVNNGGSGAVGTFTPTGNYLSLDDGTAGITAYGAAAYSVGGHASGAYVNTVSYSALGSTGSIGNWTSTSSLNTARGYFTPTALNGYMYAPMGWDGSPVATTEKAAINANGTLGAWSYTTATPGGTRDSSAGVAYNGRIYVIGGNDGAASARIDFAAPAANGDITSWTQTTNLPAASDVLYATAYNGKLYVSFADSIAFVTINSNGTLGSTWQYTQAPDLINGGRTPLAAYGGFMYAIYDNPLGADVQLAPIYADGSLGRWQSTGNVNSAKYVHVYNGNLFDIRPYDASGSYSAPIQAIPRTARYSKFIDIGVPASISGITYNGTVAGKPNSTTTPFTFRSAGADGMFGAQTSPSAITASAAGACNPTSESYKRYVLATLIIDDSQNSAVFPDANGTASNLTDFTVNYIHPHPDPNVRLRGGKTLQSGGLSALDTCQ